MMNLTDWRERDQHFSTFYRCENEEDKNGPKCAGRSREYPTDNKRHHGVIHDLLETKIWTNSLDGECVAYMAEVGRRGLPTAWRDQLEQPISPEEVHIAVRKGTANKATGIDAIGLEFCKANWATIIEDISAMMTQMFLQRNVSTQQKHGVIVCLPKSREPTTPADLRPITLLKTDNKILARIIANRLRPMMVELLHPSQYCGVPENTIFEAVATVREAIAQAGGKQSPLCILS